MPDVNDIHLFLEANLCEYQRRDMLKVLKFWARERGIGEKKPIVKTLKYFEDFQEFIAEDWQGLEVLKPGQDPRPEKIKVNSGPKNSNLKGEVCPCGGRLVARTRKSDGHPFWGCNRYPKCNRTKNID